MTSTARIEKLRADVESALALPVDEETYLGAKSSSTYQSQIHALDVYRAELEQQNEELRRAHLELEEARDRYADLYDFAPVGYFTLSESGRIVGANLAGATLLGITRSELIGRLLSTAITGRDLVIFRRHVFDVLTASTRKTCEIAIKRADGARIFARLESIAVATGDPPARLVRTAVIDISERKAAEEHLIDARKAADAANRAKSAFLAMMSHELRTPLNSIIGFSDVIRKQGAGPAGVTEYVEYAEYIHESGVFLLSMINNILDVSKIETGKMGIEPGNLPVATVFADCEHLFGLNARARGLTLTTEIDEAVRFIWSDERAIRKILYNLVGNAVKFTPKGGSVALKARSAAEGGVTLEVSDTGVGIPHSEFARVLEPFEQLDNRFNRSRNGTGLGLTLVQGLVTLHKGRLDIASTPEQGSTFTVWFPPQPNAPDASGEGV